ncbi:MAG: MBL fold metallo-hydrolase [Gammaproteobacteria bacterium]|nr:MBL fold metallo-hydrolase [Gammaproteobacteria bacterium]
MNRRDIDQGDGIVTIDTGYQRDGLVASYLIQQGDLYAFVDVGSTSCLHNIRDVMRKREIRPEQIKYIMVTHVHLDHAGAAGVLMRECPEAELVVHPRGARHMADPTKLIAGASAVYGEEVFNKTFGEVLPVDVDRIVEVDDEQTLSLNGRPLLFLDTPGHAKHHYCIYDELSRSFFTGDTFGLAYEALTFKGERFIFPTTTPVQFDPQALHQSIDRMVAYLPEQMFLTHFGRIDDPAKKADHLHRHIDAFVAIAEQSYSAVHEECTANIFSGLLAYLKAELERLGCKLDEEGILEIMGMDLNLNTQGLCCWLDYKKKK